MTMIPVEKIRHEIAELEADIADHLRADQYMDGKRFGDARLERMRQALSFARARLISEAGWAELITDDERDAWLERQMPCPWPYIAAKFQAAREARQIGALRRRTISAETQLAGANAQIALLVSAAEKALAGDTEALVAEIKRVTS